MNDMAPPDRELLERVAPILLGLLASHGWTERELAIRASTSQMTINRIVNKKHVPSAAVMFRIADAFGISTDELRGIARKPGRRSVEKIEAGAA